MWINNKRGISPVIATILLVIFALSLAFVIINWRHSVDLNLQGKCVDVDFRLRSINDNKACFSDSYLNFIMDNTGKTAITGIDVWIIGKKGSRLSSLNNVFIDADSLFTYNGKEIKYDTGKYGELEFVQFTPKIGSSRFEICDKKAIRIAKAGECGSGLDAG